jgi:hypothetical protein
MVAESEPELSVVPLSSLLVILAWTEEGLPSGKRSK